MPAIPTPTRHKKYALMLMSLLTITTACANQEQQKQASNTNDAVSVRVELKNAVIEFDPKMYARVQPISDKKNMPASYFRASEYLVDKDGQVIDQFLLTEQSQQAIDSIHGAGKETTLYGLSDQKIAKQVSIRQYDRYPALASFNVRYTNQSSNVIVITKWVNNDYLLPRLANSNTREDFWSYQGASFEDRRDWVLPLKPGFYQQNYMGMNATDYGSGTAIADLWRPDIGIAVGHLEKHPKLVSLPVAYPKRAIGADLHIEMEYTYVLQPGESMETVETFVNVHTGDYYASLKTYRQLMAERGLPMAEVPDAAYEAIWCAWGYERDFHIDEMLSTLPKAREMGLKWAVLDDGWQTAEGDWHLNPNKFPNGDKDMQALVEKIHDQGLKAKLWLAPLAVDPGTDLLRDHADLLLLNKDGSTRDITWWDSYYLCPAYEGTRSYTKALIKKIVKDWGYDGLKIDGQHLNGVPPCYNPKHNHKYPEESVEQLPAFWQEVYETALSANPDAVVEICPCGTSYAFHNLPYMNQAVSSDPLSSWQIRLKGKTLKGLMGESAPYYGDHVELSDDASDFASSVGIGAIVGTKFTIPVPSERGKKFVLDRKKSASWKKWVQLYNEKMLPKGQYRGELYDIGFDRPETHAIAKDGNMFYGLYADSWNGDVELRGLDSKRHYHVKDYVNNKPLGTVSGANAKLNVSFTQYLLLELTPVTTNTSK